MRTCHLTPIDITIPYHLYHDLMNVVGQQPARAVAPIWQSLNQYREESTTEDVHIRLFYDIVYRLTGMLATAPARDAADLYMIFSEALDRHNRAVAAEYDRQRKEQWEREAPLRLLLDAAEAGVYPQPKAAKAAEPRPAK